MREWRPTGTLGYDSQPSPYRVSTEYAYDPQNQLLSKTDAASSAADHRTTSYLYDAAGNLIDQTVGHPLATLIRLTHTSSARPTSTICWEE